MKKINVLHATLYLKMGGLESIIMDLCRHHNRELFNVKVVCFNGYDPAYKKELESHGVEVIHLVRQARYDLSFFKKIIVLFRKMNIDVLHAHSGCVFNTVVCAQLANVPVKIVTEHGLPIYDDGRLMPKSFKTKFEDFIIGKLTDDFVAVSKEIEESLIARFSTRKQKISTIINGIDINKFAVKSSLITEPDGWDIAPDKIIVGSVGRLVPIKNYSCLIDAFAQLYKNNQKYHLVLIGDGPERERLKDQANDLDISAAVTILGVRNDIAKLLPYFDVFVLPSLTEGTSISLLEAQACGIPAVVTRVGGNPDIVRDDVNGFLVEVNDATGMAGCIKKIISDFKLSCQLSENARELTVEKYDICKMVQNYETMYSRLLVVK